MRGSSPIGAKLSACPGRSAAWSIKGVYARLRGLWRNDALQTRDRCTHRLRDGPGPAVHRFAIARAAPHPGHVTRASISLANEPQPTTQLVMAKDGWTRGSMS